MTYYKDLYCRQEFGSLCNFLNGCNYKNEHCVYHFVWEHLSEHIKSLYQKAYGHSSHNAIEERDVMIAVDYLFNFFSKKENKELSEIVKRILCLCYIPSDINKKETEGHFADVVENGIMRIADIFGYEYERGQSAFENCVKAIRDSFSKGEYGYYFCHSLFCVKTLRNIVVHNPGEKQSTSNLLLSLRWAIHCLVGLCYILIKKDRKYDTEHQTVSIVCKQNSEGNRIEPVVIEDKKDGFQRIEFESVIPAEAETYYTCKLQKYHRYRIYDGKEIGNSDEKQIWDSEFSFFELTDNPKLPEHECLDFISSSVEIVLNCPVLAEKINKYSSIKGEIRKIAEKQNIDKEQCQKIEELISKVIEQVNDNSNEEPLEILNNIQAKLTAAIEFNKDELERLTQKITDIIDKYGKDISNQLIEICKISTDSNEMLAYLYESKKRNRIIGYSIFAILSLFILICIFSKNIYELTKWELFCEIAYIAKDKDIAHLHAEWLEKQGDYQSAAEWYQKAKKRYSEVLDNDSTETECAYQLALLYSRAKGGAEIGENGLDKSLYKAIEYARVASKGERGVGLYLFLNLLKDDKDVKIRSYLNSLQGEYVDDKYVTLARVIMLLADREVLASEKHIDNYLRCCHVLDSLSYDDEVSNEALLMLGELYRYGVCNGDEYVVEPDIYNTVCLYEMLAFNKNDIRGQLGLLDIAINTRNRILLKDLLARLWKNGIKEFAAYYYVEFVQAGVISEPPYMKDVYAVINSANYSSAMKQIQIAKNNAVAGYQTDDYVLDFYENANTIALSSPTTFITDYGYDKMLEYFLKSEKSSTVDSISKYCESMPLGCAEYLMSMKYAKGYGVEIDMQRADSILQIAADKGYEDAVYTLSLRLIEGNKVFDGLKLLNKIAATCNRAAAYLAVYNYLNIDNEIALEYARMIDDDKYLVYRTILAMLTEPYNEHNYEYIASSLEAVVSRNIDDIKETPHLYAMLLREIADIYISYGDIYSLDNELSDRVIYYLNQSIMLSDRNNAALCDFRLGVVFCMLNDENSSYEAFKDFCEIYFDEENNIKNNNLLVYTDNMKDYYITTILKLCPNVLLGYLTNDELKEYWDDIDANKNYGDVYRGINLKSILDEFPVYIKNKIKFKDF